jgi:hypothetical protein
MKISDSPPNPIRVKALDSFFVQVAFENGEEKVFDVSPYIKGHFYSELLNKGYFKTVHVTDDGFCIEWANGQDIAPEDLYYNSVPVSD